MITIHINDEEKTFPHELSVQELLNELHLSANTIVVVLNDNIIEQANYEQTMVKDGDHVELVRIVGGG